MLNEADIRATVERVIINVLRDSGRTTTSIRDDDQLAGTLELDSLDFAVTIVNLERELRVDPFRDGTPQVSTFAELVALYEQCSDR